MGKGMRRGQRLCWRRLRGGQRGERGKGHRGGGNGDRGKCRAEAFRE